MSDLFENPEDRFSRIAEHIVFPELNWFRVVYILSDKEFNFQIFGGPIVVFCKCQRIGSKQQDLLRIYRIEPTRFLAYRPNTNQSVQSYDTDDNMGPCPFRSIMQMGRCEIGCLCLQAKIITWGLTI